MSTDDEHEALVCLIDRARDTPGTGRTMPQVAADLILASGFRRQGPITDDEREALRQAWITGNGTFEGVRDAILAAGFRRQSRDAS